MKNIIDIYDASLLDVKGTIKEGDDALAEFDKLKSTLSNKRNWESKKECLVIIKDKVECGQM